MLLTHLACPPGRRDGSPSGATCQRAGPATPRPGPNREKSREHHHDATSFPPSPSPAGRFDPTAVHAPNDAPHPPRASAQRTDRVHGVGTTKQRAPPRGARQGAWRERPVRPRRGERSSAAGARAGGGRPAAHPGYHGPQQDDSRGACAGVSSSAGSGHAAGVGGRCAGPACGFSAGRHPHAHVAHVSHRPQALVSPATHL